VCTFAIGPYCNHFFMKQLAVLGRGVFDVAYRPHAVQAQMQYMLSAAARPVLADITLTLPGEGVEGVEGPPGAAAGGAGAEGGKGGGEGTCALLPGAARRMSPRRSCAGAEAP
jgi:hypothetical protein